LNTKIKLNKIMMDKIEIKNQENDKDKKNSNKKK
jgi:hypothetical protein